MYYTHPKNLGPALKVNIIVGKRGVVQTHLQLDDIPGLKWAIEGETDYSDAIHKWLNGYAEKNPKKLPPLTYQSPTLFTERVWRKVAEVPFGTTSSYGEIALAVGHPSAYRAVGSACRKNLLMLFVPCHRVLSAKGDTSGYNGGEEIKRRLLDFER